MIYLIESHNLLSAKNWGNWTSYLVLRREGRAAAGRGGGGWGVWPQCGKREEETSSSSQQLKPRKSPLKILVEQVSTNSYFHI